MIHVPTAIWAHDVGDVLAWAGAALGGRWVYRHYLPNVEQLARQTSPSYFISLALGGAAGAWLFGSLNTLLSATPMLSHSIAGALAGAIVAVELWKWRKGVRGSTGGVFVVPLCIGIIIGRWGCFFTGLPDRTYGVPTTLPWGMDVGDGIARHPVALYESACMAVFLYIYLRALKAGVDWAKYSGFHALIIVYSAQRFAWEFLKPYPRLLGPLNIFHVLTLGMMLYGYLALRRTRIVAGQSLGTPRA